METKSKSNLTPEQQEIVSQRMAHRTSVARQSYQATLQSTSKAGALFMKSITKNSLTPENEIVSQRPSVAPQSYQSTSGADALVMKSVKKDSLKCSANGKENKPIKQ